MRRVALFLALVVLAAGCGDSKDNPLIPPQGLPANSTPAGALARFEATYEGQMADAYAAMFTADFVFHFSTQSDPDLAAQYASTWGVDDEHASATHLFAGFTSAEEPFETFPGASAITLTLVDPQFLNELSRPDSAAFYRYVVVPRVDLEITVAASPDPIVYSISAPHDFYLVRGDAAVLDSTQAADSLHWYIRRWDDRSPPTAGAPRASGRFGPQHAMPASARSWGSVKSLYR